MVRYSKLLHMLVMASNDFDVGNVIGASIDTETWKIKDITLSLSSRAAHALGIETWHGYSTACMPVSLVEAIIDDILTINKPMSQLGCQNGIIQCQK